MANEEQQKPTGPVVVDAATFSPAPRNVFRYNGSDYKAFSLTQLKKSFRNHIAELERHLTACETFDQQIELLLDDLCTLVPGIPREELAEEPLELLLDAVLRVAYAHAQGGEVPPTPDQPK